MIMQIIYNKQFALPSPMFYRHVHIGISEMQLVPNLAIHILQQPLEELQMLHLVQIIRQIDLEVEFVSVLQTFCATQIL